MYLSLPVIFLNVLSGTRNVEPEMHSVEPEMLLVEPEDEASRLKLKFIDRPIKNEKSNCSV